MTLIAKRFMMKILILFIAAMITIPAAYAQVENNFGEKGAPTVTAVPRTMTYQGILKDSGGNPIPNTTVNVTFRIFDDEYVGNMEWDQIVGITTNDNGLFSTVLDNLNIPFDENYWFELHVIGEPSPMLPRQKINMSAYSAVADTSDFAIHSLSSDTSAFSDTSGFAAYSLLSDISVYSDSTDAITDGGVDLADLGQNGAASGQVMKWSGSAWVAADDDVSSMVNYWTLTGNVLYTAAGYGIARAGNPIYGSFDSSIVNLGVACTTGIVGQDVLFATIGGGLWNRASGSMSTIAGGSNNITSKQNATVVGGDQNNGNGTYAFVGGGYKNYAGANFATISGGYVDTITGTYGVIGGGYKNKVYAIGSTVGGGSYNKARGEYSVVAGGGGAVAADSNSASGDYSAVSGGKGNIASATGASAGGGYYNKARGQYSVVAGGGGQSRADSNSAFGDYSVIGGGRRNNASGAASTVGGGYRNTASGDSSTVAGGGGNTAGDFIASVGGGKNNNASGAYSTIGGGWGNFAFSGATIGGGVGNTAGYSYSTVGGGMNNTASNSSSTIGGGSTNTAAGPYATISGGFQNTVSSDASTVSGGAVNAASGMYSTVPGGNRNRAGGFLSIAAGYNSKANHDGSIVIAANFSYLSADSIYSGGDDQMVFRADGGMYITNTSGLASYDTTKLINTSSGAFLTTGGVWTNSSDRNLKENFVSVNNSEVLEKIASLPISKWNYKAESDEIKHIGPVAQDFHKVFGVGSDDKSISTIDPSGIALAGIQALLEEIELMKTRIAELEANR